MKKDIIQKNIVNSNDKESRSISNGVEAKIYNQKGAEAGKINLPEKVFATK